MTDYEGPIDIWVCITMGRICASVQLTVVTLAFGQYYLIACFLPPYSDLIFSVLSEGILSQQHWVPSGSSIESII